MLFASSILARQVLKFDRAYAANKVLICIELYPSDNYPHGLIKSWGSRILRILNAGAIRRL